jgi:hypothetical protein
MQKVEGYTGDSFDGNFTFRIGNFFDVPELDENEERTVNFSDIFEFCGFSFQLAVWPKGAFEGSEYIGVKLISKSTEPVMVSYKIGLLPRAVDEDSIKKLIYLWSDPDGVITFEREDEPDSSWGRWVDES